jgi:multiple sugar transport system substrate-binding protein
MGLAACAPGSSGGGSQGGGGGGGTNLALTWWGNPTRNKNTDAMIAAYMKANPDVKISGQPGEFSSYWDKLATQTAGGQAPDIIQMDMNYISEYGTRGALLDLSSVDTSKFVKGTVDSGKMNLPDDKTWTWDQMIEVGAEAASKAGVPFGVSALLNSDTLFGAFVRQHGKELFTPDGLGFEAAEAQAWYDLLVKGVKAKAFGTPEQMTEELAKPLDQSAIVVGTAAMQYQNSNQLLAVSNAAGQKIEMLRPPSLAGKATERKGWYKASMLWSASAKTKNPEAAIAWINWYANNPEAAGIDLAERGIPANAEVLAAVKSKFSPEQQVVAKFISDIKTEVGNTPIAPPPGGGTIAELLSRHGTDVIYGRTSSAEGAQKFVDELKSNLKA